ncbi:MAG: hypothetical protein K2L62_05410 [Muribaculaceae bacterium]|nr:hypothetical protein [Muribaculaceae bacterium]
MPGFLIKPEKCLLVSVKHPVWEKGSSEGCVFLHIAAACGWAPERAMPDFFGAEMGLQAASAVPGAGEVAEKKWDFAVKVGNE